MDEIRTQTSESRRLLAFLVIAFSFTWFFRLPLPLSQMGWIPASILSELGPIGAFGPLVAVIAVAAASEGSSGVKTLLSRAVDARFARRWWLAILTLMPAISLVVLLLAVMTDGGLPPTRLDIEPFMNTQILFSLLLLIGHLGEEFGWRGYALPRLQAKYSALVSSVILGFLWAVWQIPRFFIVPTPIIYQTPIWTFIPTVVATTILFTWVYNNTSGSLPAMLLLRATFDYFVYGSPALGTSLGYAYFSGVFVIVAVVVTVVAGPRELRRQPKNGTRR